MNKSELSIRLEAGRVPESVINQKRKRYNLTKFDECVSDDDIKELFRVLVRSGKRGNINAIMALFAYRYGRPKDRVELSGNEEKPITVIIRHVRNGIAGINIQRNNGLRMRRDVLTFCGAVVGLVKISSGMN